MLKQFEDFEIKNLKVIVGGNKFGSVSSGSGGAEIVDEDDN
ncbi:hypothetical protein [uncultured Dokdonia sp.]|nr:hypothetical protein [uncultured Dokdonia sp.]